MKNYMAKIEEFIYRDTIDIVGIQDYFYSNVYGIETKDFVDYYEKEMKRYITENFKSEIDFKSFSKQINEICV